MKKITQITCILFLIIFNANAQQERGIIGYSNWLNNWTDFRANKTEYGAPNQILAGNISVNTKLLKRNIYVLQGDVYVTNNAVLTIEPGTLILGDFDTKGTLIITKGATIMADGLETDPIVFTSNKGVKKAGDWGGLVILGNAPINKFGNVSSVNLDLDPALTVYGGDNVSSNSGVLRFVRIEFAGKRVKSKGNFNGLMLAGVGNQTVLENIMVSFAAGDSFAFDGGDITASKLVSYKTINDDFRFTQGCQARLNNSLAIRSSYLSSNRDGSRCLEVVCYDKKELTDFSKKQTSVVATNLTFLNDSNNIAADIQSGLVKEAVYVGEYTSVDMKRCVISGFFPAVILDSKISINDQSLSKMKFEEMYFNLCKGNIFTEYDSNNEDLENWYGNTSFRNYSSQTDNKDTFIDFSNDRRPDFRLQIGKITASSK